MNPLRSVAGPAVSAAVLAGAATAIGRHYSTVLISPRRRVAYPERVLYSTPDTVVLARTRRSVQPGTWGLRWAEPGRERLALLGDVLGAPENLGAPEHTARAPVVRALGDGPRPPAGPAALDVGTFDPDPSVRGLAFDEVDVRTPLGPAAAWRVPGDPACDDWVVAVHGRGSARREALRIMPALHRLGLHQLVIGYRNDDGAPPAPDRRYHLGDTEWRDLEAGVAHALGRGARRIVLLGWSMGAAIGGAFLDRSALAGRVAAVVWDAPLLDWRATLRLQASGRYLPPSLAGIATGFTAARIGIDFDRFDLVHSPPAVRPPTLVVHSDADRAVPVAPSRALAAAAPRLDWPLRYLEVAGVEHTGSWNADPARYERAVTGFLRETLG